MRRICGDVKITESMISDTSVLTERGAKRWTTCGVVRHARLRLFIVVVRRGIGTIGSVSPSVLRDDRIAMRRAERATSMTLRGSRRDSDVVLSNFGHKEHLFKFLVIGDYGVGKTALVRRYTEGKFSSNYKITIGADFAIKTLDWDPQTKINLQLWDIAGHERFGYMTRVYYKYAVAAALVFDISRAATFQSMKKWLNDLREKVMLPDGSGIPVVLLANKCDISVAVTDEQISKFCRENKINAWYATSAKNNTNVDAAIRYLVDKVLSARIDNGIHDSIRLRRESSSNREKSICCK